MKTKFIDKLFEKQIDAKSSSMVTGGLLCTSMTANVVVSQMGNDTITSVYNDNGKMISTTYDHC